MSSETGRIVASVNWEGNRNRGCAPTKKLTLATRQHRFEVGWLFFPGHDVDLDLLEACRFEPAVQITFRKAGPAVAVEFVSLLEVVAGALEDLLAAVADDEGPID